MPLNSAWHTSRGPLSLDTPRIMGIINVTPDSFFDGGQHASVEQAIAHAGRLLAEGADILDVGGESTRPGAAPVSQREELERVLPVIAGIVERWPDALVSVDTVKGVVAWAALDAGAVAVNDVSGLRLDPGMAEVVAETNAGLVLMHSRGTVEEMASYATADYGDDPVAEIVSELVDLTQTARAAGVAKENIVLDPGLGFSKRTVHSVAVLAQLGRLTSLGYPVMIGASRRRFVGELTGGTPAEERLEGTIAACVDALSHGARIFRVHDVAATRRALTVAEAIRTARS